MVGFWPLVKSPQTEVGLKHIFILMKCHQMTRAFSIYLVYIMGLFLIKTRSCLETVVIGKVFL